MLRFLYTWFGWLPVVGGVFKGLYIGSLVSRLVAHAQGWVPQDPSIRNQTGAELDEALAEEANSLVDEFVDPLDLGVIASVVKSMAIEKVVSVMRKSVLK